MKTPPGTLRLFVAGCTTWVVAATASSNEVSAKVMLAIFVTFFPVALGLTHLFKRGNLRALFSLTAITVGFCLVVLAKIIVIDIEVARALDFYSADSSVSNALVTVTGFPNSIQTFSGDRFVVEAKSPGFGVRSGVVLWIDDRRAQELGPGDKIAVSGTVSKERDSLKAALSLNVKDFYKTEESRNTPVFLRTLLRESSENLTGGELVPGFAVGDTSLVSPKLDFYMKESSLTHLTAVSGSNCAMITALVVAASGRLGARKRIRIVLAAITLSAFVMIVGPDASVLRAAIMAAVTLASGFGGKKNVAFASLGLAMLALLIHDPWQAKHPGFTLSVAATAGILLLNKPLENGIRKAIKIPQFFTLPLTVSLSAQIACAPLLLLLQPGIPAAGIPANILAAPAAPAGTFFGLLALLSLPVSFEIGNVFLFAATIFTSWVAATAKISANLPFARWPWPGGATGAIMLLIVELLIIVGFIKLLEIKRGRKAWSRRAQGSQSQRITLAVSFSLALSIFSATVFVHPVVQKLLVPSDWSLVACDVGQGDATIIRNPENVKGAVLIDTGDNVEKLDSCLRLFGIKKLDMIVLTHDDKDHVGALPAVIDKTELFAIAKPLAGASSERRVLEDALTHAKKEYYYGVAGAKPGIIHPREEQIVTGDNEGSIVMLGESNSVSYLLLADTGRDAHMSILGQGFGLSVDVVKVAHHGSKDYAPELLQKTGARLAIVSSGAANRYGHPSKEVLKTLEENEITVLRTDQMGHIAVSKKENELSVWTQKRAEDLSTLSPY